MERTEMSNEELRRVEVLARARSKQLRTFDASKLLHVSYWPTRVAALQTCRTLGA